MTKIVICSDNHGDDYILEYIRITEKDADLFIHLGDSEAFNQTDLDGFEGVLGNNDWMLDLPKARVFEVEGHRILATHGTHFGYFDREQMMAELLEENDCDIMLSGHTHRDSFEEYEGYLMINPGSTSWPRGGSTCGYGILYLDGDKIQYERKEL